ncbi:DNA mismatch repair protein MSH6 [Abeliophyllum distichum]|uniref:DNA mismatch repair protein MSH6 n=1 Tax=Abeliophyllum distichum TaxID=126358 RepID=A0ABD1TCP7_9LAMI
MASKRSSNGRSPLVNQRQQITAFFSNQNPNPNSTSSQKPSPSPKTPPSCQTKRKKPLLTVGPNLFSSPSSPDSAKKLYGQDVVDKRIKVYCPLDKSWYEGWVKSFDNILGKHLVQYEDANEELLNLSEEQIEWVAVSVKKKFRRLRKISLVEDEEDRIQDPEDIDMEDDNCSEEWTSRKKTRKSEKGNIVKK